MSWGAWEAEVGAQIDLATIGSDSNAAIPAQCRAAVHLGIWSLHLSWSRNGQSENRSRICDKPPRNLGCTTLRA
jgi:hypothetical protein